MKIQVDIDQEKIQKIRSLNKNLHSKREIVDLALNELIKFTQSSEINGIRRKVEWESDLNEMRTRYVQSIEDL